jgi:hypothetical protein
VGIATPDIEVLEMQFDDMAFEFLEAFNRVEAGADPVAGVSAGTDARAAAFNGGENGVGIPVV